MHKIIHVKLLFVQQIQHNTSNNKSKEDFYWKQKNKVFVHLIQCVRNKFIIINMLLYFTVVK